MAGVTTPDSIAYTTTGDGVTLAASSAAMAGSIQAALNTRIIKSYKWANVSARTAQTGMSEGDVGDQADTNVTYRYDGAAWNPTTAGTYLIIPGSVAGAATISQTGRISFAAATNLSVNNCFSSAYDSYLIKFNAGSSTASANVRFTARKAGTDTTTSIYFHALYQMTSVTPSYVYSTASPYIVLGNTGTANGGAFTTEIFGPALAQWTYLSTSGNQGSVMTLGNGAVQDTQQYDGFTLTTTAGNMTGSLTVYGYNKG